MISRFYLKDYLSFKQLDCEFENGLIIFSGPSGAGKSILMNSILSLFGNGISKAKLSEVTIENSNITSENFSIEKNEEFVIKQTTSSKTRYLLNSQTISKKDLIEFTSSFSKHLHLKDTSDFKSSKIISFLDKLCEKEDQNFITLQNNFSNNFKELSKLKQKLEKINTDEQNLDELIEFTKFEIQKIESLAPKIGELEDLKEFKSKLSRKEKVEELLLNAKPTLDNIYTISELLTKLDVDSSFFDDAINDVHNHIEKFNDSFDNLCDDEIENVLTRIEELSKLEKKYGSLEDAIKYKETKKIELEQYDNITFEKAILEKNIKKISLEIDQLSKEISISRKSSIPKLLDAINVYLKLLYLDKLDIQISEKSLDHTGCDNIEFLINNTSLKEISSGEFNRLRLALLTARSQVEINTNGILFLDEIDANLSGKESESIAKVLKELSKSYQIFAISHQPQLSATANQHFLVYKKDNVSTIKLLDKEERINEISRMISGEDITKEARVFAKKLIDNEDML
ncbi:MAG: AAA family ATPase [Campylobacteraceae bacterium]|jgi:DNA repair protein RecN (Recombination protein N)|nr:AAA family ATPase [Campylobacteraceae bacterium]MBT3882867.1 AAA family ATPase [Campylobacteraceae bacterium]MBT4030293.1 AAA family ATPase [Campylobacteraceae bacterium]MBT4179635.1 AAA family ATPase [Campylobacteraceae bacterium]MBT4572974.1 AAA family ATPase [Campylobacteraceae bacterium]